MLKYTPHTLQKIEKIFFEIAYQVRYEKGNFQSGFCVLEEKKMVVINKFLTIDGKINNLIDILLGIEIDKALLSDESQAMLKNIVHSHKNSLQQASLFEPA